MIIYTLLVLLYLKNVALQTYKVSLNQNLETDLLSVVRLANNNLYYLDQFEKVGSLSVDSYERIKDNHWMIHMLFSNMEALKLFQDNLENRGKIKRSHQVFDMGTYIDNLEYGNYSDNDTSYELLRIYYNQINNRIAALMAKKDDSEWSEEVEVFLDSGNEGVWLDDRYLF